MYGVIYKVTNLINYKVYIGQTIDFKRRKIEHLAKSSNTCYFHNAIAKYHKNNFQWEIIDKAETKEELNEKEIYWIEVLKTYAYLTESKGYNMTRGGLCGCNEGVGVVQLDINNGSYINEYKSTTEASRQTGIQSSSISSCCARKIKSAGKFLWVYKSEYNINNIYEYTFSEGVRKKVIQLSLDGSFLKEYKSIKEASLINNINPTSISECCLHKRGAKRVENFMWIFSEEYDENKDYRFISKKGKWNVKSITKLTKDGRFICEYSSATDAAIENNLDNSNIIKCCHGKLNSSGGFNWMFSEDYYRLYNAS